MNSTLCEFTAGWKGENRSGAHAETTRECSGEAGCVFDMTCHQLLPKPLELHLTPDEVAFAHWLTGALSLHFFLFMLRAHWTSKEIVLYHSSFIASYMDGSIKGCLITV